MNKFSRDLVQGMKEAVAFAEGKKGGARVHRIEEEPAFDDAPLREGIGVMASGGGDICCGNAPATQPPTTDRAALVKQAFRLEWLTIAWTVIESVVAIGAGIVAGSLTLMAFGLDSIIELASADVLIWRLTVELRHGDAFSERAELTASRIGGVLLFTLAAYIVAGAAWDLWMRHGGSFSLPGLIVALLALPIMTLLARRKIAIATQLGSRAMRADAAESITCGWLSLVVVVGLLADFLLGAWWVDAVTRSRSSASSSRKRWKPGMARIAVTTTNAQNCGHLNEF